MTGTCFYGHNVALLQVQVVHVVVVSLACMLELHLNQIGGAWVSGHVGKPVVSVQLLVLASHSLVAQSSVTAYSYCMFIRILSHIMFNI